MVILACNQRHIHMIIMNQYEVQKNGAGELLRMQIWDQIHNVGACVYEKVRIPLFGEIIKGKQKAMTSAYDFKLKFKERRS